MSHSDNIDTAEIGNKIEKSRRFLSNEAIASLITVVFAIGGVYSSLVKGGEQRDIRISKLEKKIEQGNVVNTKIQTDVAVAINEQKNIKASLARLEEQQKKTIQALERIESKLFDMRLRENQ